MGWLRQIAIFGIGQAVVREIAGAILANIGWGPIILGLFSSISAMVGAWFEGKTVLDITVYGLATFASVLFIAWILISLVATLRGRPMTMAIRDRLTLGEIADRWAAENAGHPGAITRDEILEELFASVWAGFFEDKDGNSQLILISPANHFFDEDDYGEWNRQLLLSALLPRIQRALPDVTLPTRMDLTPAPDSTPKEWAELRKAIPWSRIAKLRLNIYEETDRTAYIEPLSVSKHCFRRWTRKTRRSLPQFWFGD